MRAIKTWWLDYRTYRILTQLNDYQLKDIGLNRNGPGNDILTALIDRDLSDNLPLFQIEKWPHL